MTPEQAFETACRTIHDCFLCGSARLAMIGCYVPPDHRIIDVPIPPPNAHQQRTFWYGICYQCIEAGDTAVSNQVEERIEAMGASQRN